MGRRLMGRGWRLMERMGRSCNVFRKDVWPSSCLFLHSLGVWRGIRSRLSKGKMESLGLYRRIATVLCMIRSV